jgi:hypothetical protein
MNFRVTCWHCVADAMPKFIGASQRTTISYSFGSTSPRSLTRLDRTFVGTRAVDRSFHITNFELAKHEGRALGQLFPRQFFGFDWNYEGARPMIIPF